MMPLHYMRLLVKKDGNNTLELNLSQCPRGQKVRGHHEEAEWEQHHSNPPHSAAAPIALRGPCPHQSWKADEIFTDLKDARRMCVWLGNH